MPNKTKIDDVAKIEMDKKSGKVKIDFNNKKFEKGIKDTITKMILKNFTNAKKS